jgi:ABC-type glycerol-3-phosphate transport system substrate-binding protein
MRCLSRLTLISLLCLPSLAACFATGNKTAVLWTDRPEFAVYAGYFNASQNQYRVEARYFESPAQRLVDTREFPDMVAGSWLKSASTRSFFKPLDSFFRRGNIPKNAFYPRLLALGNIDGNQYLLPVSFNIPALIFARDKGELLSNPFTIGFEEMKTLGKAYNQEQNGAYTRMGFSPAWDDEFLFVIATLFNTAFREAAPLAWDAAALEQSIAFTGDWIRDVNTGVQTEEEFTFKYLSDPPPKLVLSGRILFAYMNSAGLFTLAEERQTSLDFRWVAENNAIPVREGAVYYGIAKKGRAQKAADAFTFWLFQAETQRLLLEKSRDNRMIENSFGIGGGFSAMRQVTEQIFPQFYPSLLGRMPPEDFLSPANILPRNWTSLKKQAILPYLHDRIHLPDRKDLVPLERRVADWRRLNRE